MKNKDALLAKREKFAQNFKNALDAKDETKIAEAFGEFADDIQQSLLDTANEITATADSAVLARRGIRQLTSAEQKFYTNLATAMKDPNPQQALANVDVTIPQTVIDTVLTDIENSHPLLAAINIQNTFGKVKWIYSDDTKQMAQWAAITTAIAQELSGTIHSLEFSTCKLSAFIPVPKDLLDLAPAYLDAYVRIILADALAYGLEYGFTSGTGKNMPIGMRKNINGAVTNGEYPDKTKVKLKSLDIKSYCNVIAKIAKSDLENGKTRTVPKVDLIVNPVDYITKIVPATTVLATDGSYKNNIFPYPTTVYPSEMIEEGTAIIGMLDKYAACLSTGKDGKVDYSDQYQFLEDNRVYLIKLYGTGRPKNNNDFVLLDISALEPLKLNVTIENIADFPTGSTTTTGSGS